MLSWGWFTEEPKGLLTCLEMTETGENEKVEEVRWFDPLCFQRFRESVLCQWSKLVSGWNWACGQAGDHCSLGKAGSQSHKGPRVKILSLAKFYSNVKSWLIGKVSDAGRDWGQEEKGMTEDEMAGWHHWQDGRESEWTPGVGDGQGGLACCDSWGCKELDTTEWLNWTELNWRMPLTVCVL